jgi:hypothetical protein
MQQKVLTSMEETVSSCGCCAIRLALPHSRTSFPSCFQISLTFLAGSLNISSGLDTCPVCGVPRVHDFVLESAISCSGIAVVKIKCVNLGLTSGSPLLGQDSLGMLFDREDD